LLQALHEAGARNASHLISGRPCPVSLVIVWPLPLHYGVVDRDCPLAFHAKSACVFFLT
jgi:hypothetical protein